MKQLFRYPLVLIFGCFSLLMGETCLAYGRQADTTIFNDDFSTTREGEMPVSIKTNGAGKVTVIDGLEGKWLKLEAGASYKLSRSVNLPPHFTISFDVVPLADDITDLSPFIFGFTVNNSVKSYIMDAYNNGGICVTALQYYNKNVVNVSSSATKVFYDTKLDMTGYTYQKMHVEITGDGDRVKEVVGGTTIANTKLFRDNVGKYFFFSAPLQVKNNGSVAIGNLVITAGL
jgi:hypothetical protein